MIFQSLKNTGLHCQLKDLVALLEHLMLQRSVVNWQLTVLQDEFLHDVAVVHVYGKNLSQADENIVLHSVLGVNEWSQFLREINGLVHRHLSSLLLVLLEKECKSINDLRPWCPVGVKTSAVLKHGVILAQLWQEVVEGLDGTRTEDLVQDVDLSQELASDFLEASWKLGDVGQGDLKVVSEVGEAVTL